MTEREREREARVLVVNGVCATRLKSSSVHKRMNVHPRESAEGVFSLQTELSELSWRGRRRRFDTAFGSSAWAREEAEPHVKESSDTLIPNPPPSGVVASPLPPSPPPGSDLLPPSSSGHAEN